MRQVKATGFRTHFGDLVDLVRDEPIEVLRGSKPMGVFVSRDEYEQLQSLGDACWIARATAAETGFVAWVERGEAHRHADD